MIVLGADTHKRSHTVAAVAAATGELLGEQTVAVGRRGFGALLRWARGLDGERVWALEDCRHVSGSLERFLIERGERVLRIPTHLTAKARRSARQRGKSDPIDALNVARAALQEGLDVLPGRASGRARARPAAAGRPPRAPGPPPRRAQQHAAVAPARSLARARSCRAARCSRRSGARGSAGAWPAPSRRCASGSRATSCAACASSPQAINRLEREITELVEQLAPQLLSRAGVRAADRRQARRRDRRRAALCHRGQARPRRRRRTDPGQLRQHAAPAARPGRQPPDQRRASPRDRHPRALPPRKRATTSPAAAAKARPPARRSAA